MTADGDDPIISKYSRLALAALSGDDLSDCDRGAAGECSFGAVAYADRSQAPESAFRASLGCGNPLMVAGLRPGDTVLDLGSGGGLDVLLSARRVAPDGVAYGLDASADMLALARANADQTQVTNARFLHGRIESIPLPDNHVDVVISNCVINLSGDKPAVLAEAFRVLKPGGRLGISDVTADEGANPVQLARSEQDVGCLAGALTQPEYQRLLTAAGFSGVTITSTSRAADGLHSAIIQAIKPDRGLVRGRQAHERVSDSVPLLCMAPAGGEPRRQAIPGAGHREDRANHADPDGDVRDVEHCGQEECAQRTPADLSAAACTLVTYPAAMPPLAASAPPPTARV